MQRSRLGPEIRLGLQGAGLTGGSGGGPRGPLVCSYRVLSTSGGSVILAIPLPTCRSCW